MKAGIVMKSMKTYRGKKKSTIGFSVTKARLETTFDRLLNDNVYNRSKVFESSSETEKKVGWSTNTSNEAETQISMGKPKFFISSEKQETPVDIAGLLQDSSLAEKGSRNGFAEFKKKKNKKTNYAKRKGVKKLTHYDKCLDRFVKNVLSKQLFASTPIKPARATRTKGKFTVTNMSPIIRDHIGLDLDEVENIAPSFEIRDSVVSPIANVDKFVGGAYISSHLQKEDLSICSGSSKTGPDQFEAIEDKLESLSLTDGLFQSEQISNFLGFTSVVLERKEVPEKASSVEIKSPPLTDKLVESITSFHGFAAETSPKKELDIDCTAEKYEKLEEASAESRSSPKARLQSRSYVYEYPILKKAPLEPLDEVRLQHRNVTLRRKEHYERKRAEVLKSSLLCSTPLVRVNDSNQNQNYSSSTRESFDEGPTPVKRFAEQFMKTEIVSKSESLQSLSKTFTVRDFPVYRPGSHVSLDGKLGTTMTAETLEEGEGISPLATFLSSAQPSPDGQCDASVDMFAESVFSPPVSIHSYQLTQKLTSPVTDQEDTPERVESGDVLLELGQRITVPGGKKYRRSLFIIQHLAQGSLREAEEDEYPLVEKGRLFEQSVCEVIQLQNRDGRNSLRPPIRTNETASRHSVFISSPFRKSVRQSIFIQSPRISKICPRKSERLLRISLQRKPGFQGEDYFKDRILSICSQNGPCSFETMDGTSEPFAHCSKIGEGVFGEVFVMKRNNRRVVLKIIPIEGSFLVNGEPQKKYSEVYSELTIAHHLHELRGEGEHRTEGFAELSKSWLIEGRYPDRLIQLWDDFNLRKGSDNDSPLIFPDHQLYLVLELGHAGTDMANYSFPSAKQALSVFQQVTAALAVAEQEYKFEHRDLHWGNVLISKTIKKFIHFSLNGETFKIKTAGVKGTIIDFTLSSMTIEEERIFNDVGKDPEMFIASGDYQFDIYRHMKDDLGNDWKAFVPKTNVRWLHYLVDKMIRSVKYLRPGTKAHTDSISVLKEIESWLLDCTNCADVALKIIDL